MVWSKGAWLNRPRAAASAEPLAVDHLAEYRKGQVEACKKSQDDFDKTLVSLAGGALGVSFVYLKDIVGTEPINQSDYLFFAWGLWGFSSLAVMYSYLFSVQASRKAIQQVDGQSIHKGRAGGFFSSITEFLNWAGAASFLIGLVSISVFVFHNLPKERKPDGNKAPLAAQAPAASAASALAPAVPGPKGSKVGP